MNNLYHSSRKRLERFQTKTESQKSEQNTIAFIHFIF
jgi:hypothetical protein